MARRDTQGTTYRAIVAGLIRERRARGVTQVEIARRMGIDQSQVSKLERGERRLDVIDYARYCGAIELDPGELLKPVITGSKLV